MDVGSGWDAPAHGQMTLWGFTEALLLMSAALREKEAAELQEPPPPGQDVDSSAGLAPYLERLLDGVHAPPP